MKIITAKVVRLDNDNEVLRFIVDEGELDVALTSQDGINELKAIYESLLAEVMEGDVTVELEDREEATTAMYQDVCKEYIALLNDDLVSARREIVDRGLGEQP